MESLKYLGCGEFSVLAAKIPPRNLAVAHRHPGRVPASPCAGPSFRCSRALPKPGWGGGQWNLNGISMRSISTYLPIYLSYPILSYLFIYLRIYSIYSIHPSIIMEICLHLLSGGVVFYFFMGRSVGWNPTPHGPMELGWIFDPTTYYCWTITHSCEPNGAGIFDPTFAWTKSPQDFLMTNHPVMQLNVYGINKPQCT